MSVDGHCRTSGAPALEMLGSARLGSIQGLAPLAMNGRPSGA